uniref:Secreted peptide n=1 Tax=Rhipicephalus pulchellus TaxID=72859 RepID=L7LXL3_RHIPC
MPLLTCIIVCSLTVSVCSELLIRVLYFSWENVLTSQLPSWIAMQSNVNAMFSPKCVTAICMNATCRKCGASHETDSIHWFCNVC